MILTQSLIKDKLVTNDFSFIKKTELLKRMRLTALIYLHFFMIFLLIIGITNGEARKQNAVDGLVLHDVVLDGQIINDDVA